MFPNVTEFNSVSALEVVAECYNTTIRLLPPPVMYGVRYVERSLLKEIDGRADATLDSSMSSSDQRSR